LGGGVGVQAAPVKGSTQGAVCAATGVTLKAWKRITANKNGTKTPETDTTELNVLFPIISSFKVA
jgi:hypothetical protein